MKILLPVDDSSHSRAAGEAVAARPWPAGTRVRVLSAYTTYVPVDLTAAFTLAATEPTLEEAAKKQATDTAERVATLVRDAGLSVETAVEQGDARHVIIETAKEWNADLIVMGSRGLGGLARVLIGSVAHYVVAHAPCSVEVVRARENAKGTES